jgi:carbohydrate diacid regulator
MLNKRNCQIIAETASSIIGYSVLLTGNDGIVLGSSEEERVGTLHEASLEVIRSGCQVFHNEQQAKKLQGTRPGTTIPVIINDQVVGTIGITGHPEQISKYGTLIKKLAEVFLKDQLEMESARLLEQSRQNLLRELLTYAPNTAEERVVLNHGRVLGYDLLLPRAAVVIEVAKGDANEKDSNDLSTNNYNNFIFHVQEYSIIKQAFNHQHDLCVELGNNRYLVFAYLATESRRYDHSEWIPWLTERCESLVSRFIKSGLAAWVGIGDKAETVQGLRNSYHDANQAMHILKCKSESGVQYINDVYMEQLILSIPEQVCKRVYEGTIEGLNSLKNGDELIDMVICWCENKFNLSQTARSLNIHKNTLIYRFSKFKEITGFDLNDFKNAIALYIVITRHKRLNQLQNNCQGYS